MPIPATDHRTQTQLDLLAATLAADTEAVANLAQYDADTLYALRAAISAHLFDDQASVFARVSRLAPLVPNSVVAKIVPGVVPPLVAGRAAGALGVDHPDRIEDLLGRLPADYLADCAPHLDPRIIAVLAPTVPSYVLIPAARILLARREYLTAATFVEHATPELIADFERDLDDDLGLLMTASLVYSDAALDSVVGAFPIERLRRIVTAGLADEDCLRAAITVLDRLSPDLRERLGPELQERVLAATPCSTG